MSKEERRALLQFMRLVLNRLHPNVDEYPIEQMKLVEWSQGEEFEGTEFEDSGNLMHAYYMLQSISVIEG